MSAKPQPRRRPKKVEQLPGQTPGPGGHTGFPVRGCGCWLCATHRACERREAETRHREAASANDTLVEGSVEVAPNATAEFRAAVGARYDP